MCPGSFAGRCYTEAMKRSLQEVVELVVFGLVALLVGTALVWVLGWVLSLGGALFKALAGLLWLLLRFIVPIAIVAGLVYFLVKALQGRGTEAAAAGAATAAGTGSAASGSGATQSTVDKVKDAAGDVVSKAKEAASEVGENVSKAVGKAVDKVSEELGGKAKDAAESVEETAVDAAQQLADDVAANAEELADTDDSANDEEA